MKWYAITIKYTTVGNETRIMRKKNLTSVQLMKFREEVYFTGLYVPDEECPLTEGTIISPYQIGNIDVMMQEKKFEE